MRVEEVASPANAFAALRDARAALAAARYDEAAALLDRCEDWPAEAAEHAVAVKAELLLRDDPVSAVAYLASVGDLAVSDAARFHLALQAGKAHALARDNPSCISRYAEARQFAPAVPDGLPLLAYHEIRLRWLRRECDPQAPEFSLALAHSDPSILSVTHAYRGWMHLQRGDVGAHVAELRRAVSYAGERGIDVASIAASVHALAQVAFETGDAVAMQDAHAAAELLSWTPDVRAAHFMTLRAFGWDAFMRGAPGRAQWIFKDALALAPSDAWRVMARLDRAHVARIARNEVWALDELAEADRIARDVEWRRCVGQERVALVVLATLYAPVDPVRAQRFAATFTSLGADSAHPVLVAADDRRAAAHRQYAQGRIDQALGRRDAAIAGLRAAYGVFDAEGFRYRASLTATALVELTGEQHWRDAALAHAAAYPGCPLSSIVSETVVHDAAMPAGLTPLQRQIARAHWEGADELELSRRFSRSRYTIGRELAAVFDAFGALSRDGLRDEARRRGLT